MRSGGGDGDEGQTGRDPDGAPVPTGRRPGTRLRTAGSTVVAAARRLVALGIATYTAWRSDRTLRLGAGLAYYGLFAIVPLLAFALALVEPVFGRADVQTAIGDALERLFGPGTREAADVISQALADTSAQTGLGILGAASSLLAASLVFVALQDAINTIWEIPVESGIQYSVRRRLYAFSIVLAFGALLMAVLVVQTTAEVVVWLLPEGAEGSRYLVDSVGVLGSWTVVALGIVALVHAMTPADVGWRTAFVSGLTTAVMMTVGTWALGIYLDRVGGTSLTGAAGAVLLILLWIYYEAQILLVGFQLAKVLHERRQADPT